MRKKILTTITAAALTAALSISAWAAPYIPITEDMHDDYGVCLLGKNIRVDSIKNTRADTYAYCYSKDLAVRVNGYLTDFPDAQPFIDENSRTLIPLRFVTEALGADVSWDQTTKTATVEQDGIRCDITIGKADMLVTENGNTSTVTMDTQAVLKDSRTFVPIRYVAESLGAWVGWSNAYKTVEIVKGHLTPEEDELLYNSHIPTVYEFNGLKYTYDDAIHNRYNELTGIVLGVEPWKVISPDGEGSPENAVEYFHRNTSGSAYEHISDGVVNHIDERTGYRSKKKYNCISEDTGKLSDIIIEEAELAFADAKIPGIQMSFRTDAANILAFEPTILVGTNSGILFVRGIAEITPTSQEGIEYMETYIAPYNDNDGYEIGQTYSIPAGIGTVTGGLITVAYPDKVYVNLATNS